LLAPSGEQRNAALLSNGGEGVHLTVGRNLLRFEAGTILAKFVEKLFQVEVIE
jgi:cytochrome P450